MKSFIAIILTIVLMFAICSCASTPADNKGKGIENPGIATSPEGDAALSELQEKIEADGKLMGVAYLGYIDYEAELDLEEVKSREHIKELLFADDIYDYAENEGYAIYAIVPANDQVTINVYKCEFDSNYMPYDGEELIEVNGPVFVRGNASDTIPNLYVTAKKGSEKVEYTPIQSGMDGRLENSENLVYDFTPYDRMQEFGAFDRVPDAVFCGSWIAFGNDGNGEERALGLELNPDGTVSYVYGIGNSEVLEQFEGTWTLGENDILRLELVGGPPESVENPVVAEPYDCNPSFEWEMTTEGLSLTHIDGDEILYGTKGQTFEFEANEFAE